MARILITGSRTWENTALIQSVLLTLGDPETDTLVSGACPTGADKICEDVWPGRIERHPANWEAYGRGAGFKRNKEMVDLGADLCIAFIHNGSKGATHTADTAEKAGIKVVRFEDTREK